MSALISAILGGLSTPAGAGLAGGAIASLVEQLLGTTRRETTLSPGQERIREQLMAALEGQGPMADIFGPVDSGKLAQLFEESISVPAERRFRESIVPTITGQFRGSGLGRSDSLEKNLGRAGRDLEEGLASQMSGFLAGQQGQRGTQVSNILNSLMNSTDVQDVQRQPVTDLFRNIAPYLVYSLSNQGPNDRLQDFRGLGAKQGDRGTSGVRIGGSFGRDKVSRLPSLEA